MDLVRRVPRAFAFTFLLGLGLALVAPGCMWWHNFSTYFNTVYLANQHIEAYEAQQQAVKTMSPNGAIALQQHRWLDEEYFIRQRDLNSDETPTPITPSFSQSLSATTEIHNVHLDSAIILGSKVLADKKGTKYLEDALFIVGKAEFYKNNFADAQRKFLELLSHFPNTKFGSQVQVFLARSMLLNHDRDTARLALQQGLKMSEASGDKAATASVHRAFAELIYAVNPDSLSAIADQLRLAEDALSGEDLARLANEEGAVDFLNGDWPHAETAFDRTIKNAKDNWLKGEAHIAHALTLRESGDFAGARRELASLIDRAEYSSSQPSARYELVYTDELIDRAAVHNDLRSPEFRETYHPDLVREYFSLDTLYRNTSALILARSRFREAELFRQMGLYDSAAREAAVLTGTHDFSSLAMNEYVSSFASSLASFDRWQKELAHVDTVIETLSNHSAERGKSSAVSGQNQADAIHLKAMQQVLGNRWNPARPVPLTARDSIELRAVEARLKAEAPPELVITDTAKFVDSLHAVQANAHFELGHAYQTFDEIPKARAEYELAAGTDMGATDTAKTALRAQTLYAWMELEHQQKNQQVFDSLLHELLTHYGQTMYAGEARLVYNNSVKNSPGELAYLAAYHTMESQGLEAAKPALLHVAESFPEEDVAPRSFYAIGEQYEEAEKYDSSLAYYRIVIDKYPYSQYAVALRPRLALANTPDLPEALPRHVNPLLEQGGRTVPNREPPGVHQNPGTPPVTAGQQPPNGTQPPPNGTQLPPNGLQPPPSGFQPPSNGVPPQPPPLPPGVPMRPLPPGLHLPPGAPVPPGFYAPQDSTGSHH